MHLCSVRKIVQIHINVVNCVDLMHSLLAKFCLPLSLLTDNLMVAKKDEHTEGKIREPADHTVQTGLRKLDIPK